MFRIGHTCLRCRSQPEVPVWSSQHQAFTIIVLLCYLSIYHTYSYNIMSYYIIYYII